MRTVLLPLLALALGLLRPSSMDEVSSLPLEGADVESVLASSVLPSTVQRWVCVGLARVYVEAINVARRTLAPTEVDAGIHTMCFPEGADGLQLAHWVDGRTIERFALPLLLLRDEIARVTGLVRGGAP